MQVPRMTKINSIHTIQGKNGTLVGRTFKLTYGHVFHPRKSATDQFLESRGQDRFLLDYTATDWSDDGQREAKELAVAVELG